MRFFLSDPAAVHEDEKVVDRQPTTHTVQKQLYRTLSWNRWTIPRVLSRPVWLEVSHTSCRLIATERPWLMTLMLTLWTGIILKKDTEGKLWLAFCTSYAVRSRAKAFHSVFHEIGIVFLSLRFELPVDALPGRDSGSFLFFLSGSAAMTRASSWLLASIDRNMCIDQARWTAFHGLIQVFLLFDVI